MDKCIFRYRQSNVRRLLPAASDCRQEQLRLCSAVVGRWEEPVAKNAFVCWALNFKVRQWNQLITLLSDGNSLVRFRAQQRKKYSSLQLTVSSIAAMRWFDTDLRIFQPHRTQISTLINAPFIQNSHRMASSIDRDRKFLERIVFISSYI